jgi:hypothetical protein
VAVAVDVEVTGALSGMLRKMKAVAFCFFLSLYRNSLVGWVSSGRGLDCSWVEPAQLAWLFFLSLLLFHFVFSVLNC